MSIAKEPVDFRELYVCSEKPSEIGLGSQVDPGVMINMENRQFESDPRF